MYSECDKKSVQDGDGDGWWVVSKALHSLVIACNAGLASLFRPSRATIPCVGPQTNTVPFLAQGLQMVVSAAWIVFPHALPG